MGLTLAENVLYKLPQKTCNDACTGHRSQMWFERPSTKASSMKDETTLREQIVPSVLQRMSDEALRIWSAAENDAASRCILNQITLGQYLSALHEARLKQS